MLDDVKVQQQRLAHKHNLWMNILTMVSSSPVAAEIYKANPNDPTAFAIGVKDLADAVCNVVANAENQVEVDLREIQSQANAPKASNMKLVTP